MTWAFAPGGTRTKRELNMGAGDWGENDRRVSGREIWKEEVTGRL